MPDNNYDEFNPDVDKRLNAIEQNYAAPKKMKFFIKLKSILFQPKKFYENIKDMESDFFGALIYIVFFLAFFSVAKIISSQYQYISSVIDVIIIPFQSFFLFIIFCIGLMIYLFVLTGILHLIVKMVGGKTGFYQTFKALVYGFTPILLLGWIPSKFILIPIVLYSLFLQIVGISKLQEISYLKTTLISIWLPIASLYLLNMLTIT
jgi:hypothetical protein